MSDIARVDGVDSRGQSRSKASESSQSRESETELAVNDSVSLSASAQERAAIRQDVTPESEATQGDRRGRDEPTRSRIAAHDEQDARLRELRQRDFQVRSEQRAADAGGPLRGLPTFEYDVGPDGHHYAVDDGVLLEPLDDGVAREAVMTLDPIMAEPSSLASEPSTDSSRRSQTRTYERPGGGDDGPVGMPGDAEPRGPEVEAPRERNREAAAQARSHELDKGARAYQDAANFTGTPGGTGSVDEMG